MKLKTELNYVVVAFACDFKSTILFFPTVFELLVSFPKRTDKVLDIKAFFVGGLIMHCVYLLAQG